MEVVIHLPENKVPRCRSAVDERVLFVRCPVCGVLIPEEDVTDGVCPANNCRFGVEDWE